MNRGSGSIRLVLAVGVAASMRPRFMNRGSKVAVQLHTGGIMTLQ